MYNMLMSTFLIAQLVGCVALLFSVAIFQYNKRNSMLRLGMIAGAIYALHFFLLGAYTGSAMNLIGSIRSYIFFKTKPDKRHRWILFSFITIAAISTYITWQGWISTLPFIA